MEKWFELQIFDAKTFPASTLAAFCRHCKWKARRCGKEPNNHREIPEGTLPASKQQKQRDDDDGIPFIINAFCRSTFRSLSPRHTGRLSSLTPCHCALPAVAWQHLISSQLTRKINSQPHTHRALYYKGALPGVSSAAGRIRSGPGWKRSSSSSSGRKRERM